MELLNSLQEMAGRSPRPRLVLSIGAFDGVHIAHRSLISGAIMSARELGVLSVVLTFDPHPDSVLRPDKPLAYLTDLADQAALIAELGADVLIVHPFTPEFTRVTAEDFVQSLLDLGDLKEVHVGEDFVFGYKAGGNVVRLREMGHRHGFQVKSMALLQVDSGVVSSSRIRSLLTEGQVAQAGRLLGRAHSLKGIVIHGNERGRLLGFPTANLAVESRFAVPGNGVYATMTTFLNQPGDPPRPSVTNIGVRPTFGQGERSVETFVLDWSGDLYDQTIRVEFIEKLRDERKFAGLDEIKSQLALDVENARAALEQAGRG